MTWIADLETVDETHHLKAIGWLSLDHPFANGLVTEEFFRKLCQILSNHWNPGPCPAGFHRCEFCRFTGNGSASFEGYEVVSWSKSELYVPGDGCIYIAPQSIAHYIDAHGYRPPYEFIDAVLNCPPMRSVPYMKAILANGGRGLGKPPE